MLSSAVMSLLLSHMCMLYIFDPYVYIKILAQNFWFENFSCLLSLHLTFQVSKVTLKQLFLILLCVHFHICVSSGLTWYLFKPFSPLNYIQCRTESQMAYSQKESKRQQIWPMKTVHPLWVTLPTVLSHGPGQAVVLWAFFKRSLILSERDLLSLTWPPSQ